MSTYPPTHAPPDSCLRRAQQGDPHAFSQLAAPCETRLFRQAVAMGHDAPAAEDLVAETFIEAWKSIPRFRAQCRFSTWLYGILVHRHQKLLRRQRTRPTSLASLPSADATLTETALARLPTPEPGTAERVSQRETARQLREAIEHLPDHQQSVILLRFYDDARLSEISAALNIPLGTVKSRLHHALESLRRMANVMNLLSPPGDSPS